MRAVSSIGRLPNVVVVAALVGSVLLVVGCSEQPPSTGGNGDTANAGAQNDLDPEPVENACTDGEMLCGNECIDPQVDPRHCGGCGESCPEAHLCENGQCVSHDGDCPAEECTGFTYCEGESGLCLPGCRDDDQCTGGRICDTDTNSCVCPGEERLCGGACFALDDPDACGEDCLDCPTGGGTGTDQCVGGECQLQCEEGQRECDRRCVDCPGAATETSCDGGQCVADDCPEGERVCNGECVDCPGEATHTDCENGQCVATGCPEGQLACGGVCVDCPDGAEGVDCEDSSCVATSCIDDQSRACGGGCVECPDGAVSTDCDGDQCIATSCEDDQRRACGGDCVDCPEGADSTDCDGDQCIATSCEDDQRRACGGVCVECPPGGSSQSCNGDQCVAQSCGGDSFECGAFGCCSWEVEHVTDLNTSGYASRVTADGDTAFVAIHQDFGSSFELGIHDTGGWSFETVSAEQEANDWIPPVVLADDGIPSLFYLQSMPGNTDGYVYGQHQTTDGNWVGGQVDEAGSESVPFSAADDGDSFHLVYVDEDGNLAVAEQNDPTMGTLPWYSTEIVEQNFTDAFNAGDHADMVADDDGNLHFVILDSVITYATNSNGDWETQTVGYGSAPGTIAERRTIGIDVHDHPLVATKGSSWTGAELRVFEYDGGDWQRTDIDEGDEIRDVFVQFDAEGLAHVMFRNDDELRHAWKFDGQWHVQTIDGVPDHETVHASPYVHDGELKALAVSDDGVYRLSATPD